MENRKRTEGSLAIEEKGNQVITIPAKALPEDIKLRVAAYARVSSSSEDQMNSFAAQSNYYTTLIKGQPQWKMVDLYSDAGVTGTSAEKREDFQRLLEDCRKGLIDRILVKSISRFARNAKECLQTIRELKAIGVSVYFEEQKIDTGKMTGELLTAVFAAIAQKESESISANMRWSYQHRMESGTFLPSMQPYGYMLQNGRITIDEPKAKIVREIFRAYLSGDNIYEIAERLSERQEQCQELQNIKWDDQAITRILKNEKYTGNSLWQKKYCTDTLPVKRRINRGEKPQYYAENTHPSIIDDETYRMAQERLRQHRFHGGKCSDNSIAAIQEKLICDKCGTRFRHKVVRGKRYYICRLHDYSADACSLMPIAEGQIEEAFTRLCYKLRHSGYSILTELLQNLLSIQDRRMLWSLDIIELNKRISDIMSQNQTLSMLKKQGLVDPDIFISQSNEFAEQLRSAKQEKERLLRAERDDTIARTQEILEILEADTATPGSFELEMFTELVDAVIVESNDRVRFRLINGIELAEHIERTRR